ncbi:MAG: choice-of-anchor X domain-containing protein [bacterium]
MKKALLITIISIFLLAAFQTYGFGAPTLDSIGNKSVAAGGAISIDLHATNTGVLIFDTENLPSFCSLDELEVDFDGIAAIDCNTSCLDDGSYNITVIVYDEYMIQDPEHMDSKTFTLEVTEVNCAPELASIGPQNVAETATLCIPLSATDPEGDTLAFATAGLPGFCTLHDDGIASCTGCSGGVGTCIVCNPSCTDSMSSPYSITVTVTDDGVPNTSDSETFDLTVTETNCAPELSIIGPQVVDEGATLCIPLSATDPDGGTLTFTPGVLPGFCTFHDDGMAPCAGCVGGVDTCIVCNASCTDSVSSPYSITVTVTDDGVPNLSDFEVFDLTVYESNCPPVLSSIGPQVMDEGTTLCIPLSATDPDGDTLGFSTIGLPDFCILYENDIASCIDCIGGVGTCIVCKPTYEDYSPTSYSITAIVTDDGSPNLSNQEVFGLTVNDSSPLSGVVLLFDISGSMSTEHDGTSRLTLAKNAAIPFMILMNDFYSERANFGIATFPEYGYYPCRGAVIIPMTLITDDTLTDALIEIADFETWDATPLLNGVETAMGMFSTEINKAIVLLTDGYHNCPYWASETDPNVIALIAQLNSESIRAFSIGFGRPTDVDHPLLRALADGTTPAEFEGSQFYDVTTADFDPNTWDPAVALQSTYKSILIDALDLDAYTDPMGILKGGEEPLLKTVNINEYDQKVSVYLSWKTSDPDRLGLTVTTPDNEPIPTDGSGVSFHQGDNYKILTVDRSFLQENGKVGPWLIRIEANNVPNGENEHYQYSVIVDSDLKMETGFDKNEYHVGDTIILSAKITVSGQPVTGLEDVSVLITGPEEGIGNWFAANKVGSADLQKVPDSRGGEELLPFERKAQFLTDFRLVPFPGPTAPYTLTLYDDGTHGDAIAEDGIYTNNFSNTTKEGTYSFYFRASGQMDGVTDFVRDDVVQKYLTINVSNILVDIFCLPSEGKLRRLELTVTPKDQFGNHLDPRRAEALILNSDKGYFKGELQNMLNGSLRQVLELSSYQASSIFNLDLHFHDSAFSHNFIPDDYLPSTGYVTFPVSPVLSYPGQSFIPYSLLYLPLHKDLSIYNNYSAFPFYQRSNLPFVLPYFSSFPSTFSTTYMPVNNPLTYLYRFTRSSSFIYSPGLVPSYWYWFSIDPYYIFCD